MKPALVDTDILSEFLRGTSKVVENVEKYLQTYDAINFSIITYCEILNGLLYKDAKKQLKKFTGAMSIEKLKNREYWSRVFGISLDGFIKYCQLKLCADFAFPILKYQVQ